MENPYASPQGEIITPHGTVTPLTWKQILFSFKGRIPRRQYWAGFGIQLAFGVVVGGVIGLLAVAMHSSEIGMVLIVPFYIVSLWMGLAVAVKRCHDRDWAGWFILIPLFNIWVAIACMFLRGTEGPNRFGDDPT